MTMKKVVGPAQKAAVHDTTSKAAIAGRKTRMILRTAKDLQLPELIICNPHGTDEESIHDRILKIETDLKTVATTDNGYTFIVGTLDKASQNCINQLGGYTGAGDAAMAAYWDTLRRAVGGLAFVNGCESVELIRINLGSDEGVFNMGSRHLSRHAEAQFAVAWEQARSATDLSGYKYSIAVPTSGGTKTYNLDLEAFSSVLRHPGMALSCHYSISQPRSIQPHTEGFITDVIRHMENKEIAFYDHLPWSFREGNGGLAEVESPFRTNLTRMGVTTRSGGTFAEIKLNAPEARELLRFVGDHDGMKGTRKGFAEIYSGNFGMRGFNTFLGKARANSILTPITWAMEDISKQAANGGGKPVTVLPLSEGCYLQYWLDLPPTEGTRQVIKQAVDRRIHSENGGPGYASISFRPVITLLDASTVDVISAKQAFILKSLDKESYPVAILDRTDFLINFLQNINEKVQQDVFKKLAIGHQDRDCIAKIRYICSQRRTLRNTEDVVWTLRTDEGLRPQIKHVRHELEDWVFRFAGERFDSIYRVLADKIRERMNHRH